jgi:hypothetical protein
MVIVPTVEETQSEEVSTRERGCGKSPMDLDAMGESRDDWYWDLRTDPVTPVASLRVDSCWGN